MDEVLQHFTDARFRPAASKELICSVESDLSVEIPEVLRRMYLLYDGFREPLTNAQYLLPLSDTDGGGTSLVAINKLLWREWKLVDLAPYLFFGLSSADEQWAIDLNNHSQLVAYHHHMGSEVGAAGSDILALYLADQKAIRELGDGAA